MIGVPLTWRSGTSMQPPVMLTLSEVWVSIRVTFLVTKGEPVSGCRLIGGTAGQAAFAAHVPNAAPIARVAQRSHRRIKSNPSLS